MKTEIITVLQWGGLLSSLLLYFYFFSVISDRLMGASRQGNLLVFPVPELPSSFLSKTHRLQFPHTGETEVKFTPTLFEHPEIAGSITPTPLNLEQNWPRLKFLNLNP